MDASLMAMLERLREHGTEHDASKADRLQRLRNLEPETAQILALLVRAAAAKRVLELGTSNGYSTLWLADAVRATGGYLVSVEIDGERTAQAAENLRAAGLAGLVELRVEDAAETLASTDAASFDLLFLDAERPAYAGYWPDLLRVLRPGGLLAIDNVLSHAGEVAELRGLIAAEPSVSEALVPSGAGLLLVVRELSR